jgi:hypothetical protein
VLRAAGCLMRAITFYEQGIARLEDRWQETGETGGRFLDEDHLYARDLDVFGPGSLFQLLSRARTHLGEDLLARWLTSPSALPGIRLRQDAIAELRDQLEFREALATAGGASRDINTVALSSWASAPTAPESVWLRVATAGLAAPSSRPASQGGRRAGRPADRDSAEDGAHATFESAGRAGSSAASGPLGQLDITSPTR